MLYDYQCKQCNRETEAINRIAERNTHAPVCCEQPMQIIIKSAPMAFMDRDIHYICPVTNQEVTTRRQRNNIMAREGLVDANDVVAPESERKAARKRVKESIKQETPPDLDNAMGNIFKDEQKRFLDSMG